MDKSGGNAPNDDSCLDKACDTTNCIKKVNIFVDDYNRNNYPVAIGLS